MAWSDAGIAVDVVISGAVFMSRFLKSRADTARFGRAQAIARRGDPWQFQLWVEDLSRNRCDGPLVRGDGRIQDFGIIEKCP